MVHIYTDAYHGYTVKLGTTALHNIKGICCWLALLIMELISVQRDQQCCKEKPVKGGSKHHEIGGLVGAKFGILHWWNQESEPSKNREMFVSDTFKIQKIHFCTSKGGYDSKSPTFCLPELE